MSRKNKIRDSVADRVFQVVVVVIVTIITLTCILPIINILASSLSSANANNANIVTFWPIEITLDAYKSVVTNGALIRSMFFSIYITILTVAITLVMTILCAYPLSHRDLVGKSILWPFIMFTMYFGGGMIPSFILVTKLGLYNSPWALILPGSYSIWYIILVRSYFRTIPESLRESAKLDGANSYRILWNVFLPTSKPILAVIALYTIIGVWNSWYHASIYITDHDWQPLQLYLRRILIEQTEQLGDMMDDAEAMRRAQQQQISNNQMKYTVIIVSSLPMLIAYPFFQQYFVKGVMLGSLKE